MKKQSEILLIIILSLFLFSSFIIPRTKAQEWVYEGADTERIPSHSLYPSEWYVYNATLLTSDILSTVEIIHGNVSDPGPGKGFCVWGNGYLKNITSGELLITGEDDLISYWNESIGYIGTCVFIPVEDDGKVSEYILSNVSIIWETVMLKSYIFDYKQIYLSNYSIVFRNSSTNAQISFTYTADGIMTSYISYLLPFGNLTLFSQPAQLPPTFSFSTETGELEIDTKEIKLNITISDSDNNNDGEIDTDYLYRILNGSIWTDWASPTDQVDLNLGDISGGDYVITMEIKNMYGITQEQITITYTPPEEGIISSYPFSVISIVFVLCVSIIIISVRKKAKN